MVAEKFQLYVAKVTGKYICESKKSNLFIFTHDPSKTLPQAFIITPPPPHPLPPPGRRKLPNPSEQHFLKIYFFFQQKVREDYGVEKIGKIKHEGIAHKF